MVVFAEFSTTLSAYNRARMRARAILFLLVAGATLGATHAATKTWSGLGGDANWTTDGNWVGGTAPLAAMSERFTPKALRAMEAGGSSGK